MKYQSLTCPIKGLSKQCRSESDATERGVLSGSTQFAIHSKVQTHHQIIKWTRPKGWVSTVTLSALWTQTDIFANSVDPDETARYEPSHLDLYCLPI